MSVHEWHVEKYSPPGFFTQESIFSEEGGLPAKLAELESQGFEIFSVTFACRSMAAYIVCKRG